MPIPIVSLFSGAGFLDFAFMENNFDILWSCELEKEFSRAYEHNLLLRYGQEALEQHQIIVNDIRNVVGNEEDLLRIPGVEGVIGGPPCQDFSIGNASSPGVEGARGSLVWNYLDIIREKEPLFFLFENVEALYKVKKHREGALEPLVRIFENELDYNVEYRVLNALDYGIPQDRSRVFIVAFKNHVIELLKNREREVFNWPLKIYENPKKIYKWPTQDPFGTQFHDEEFIRDLGRAYDLTVNAVIGNETEIENLPNHVYFKPYSDKFGLVNEGDSSRKSFKRLHRFRYSPTVAYGNNEVHLHPTRPRRLSVREALRLQSVPDWYEFPLDMALDKMFKMVGNGVPYRLAELLAIEISRVMQAFHEEIEVDD